jgi:hypothetical protein
MKKHFKNDCSHCHEYPYECDDCYSEVKALMSLKTRRNKKRNTSRNSKVIYNS